MKVKVDLPRYAPKWELLGVFVWAAIQQKYTIQEINAVLKKVIHFKNTIEIHYYLKQYTDEGR